MCGAAPRLFCPAQVLDLHASSLEFDDTDSQSAISHNGSGRSERAGTADLKSRRDHRATSDTTRTCDTSLERLGDLVAADATFRELSAVWPNLSPSLRKAIAELVRSVAKPRS